MRCTHIDTVDPDLAAAAQVCEECATSGDTWVQLRVCKTCGHVGCCDSSKNRHARRHYHETGHPIIGPADPSTGHGDWLWCYPDNAYVQRDGTIG
jgi:uncharacterized UBP type Zn finger protein